ncbi:MAG: agmatine deiminase family protein [Verrucomicrobiota bacterium]|nr:agmatine deiminase family protein [Verrucomicrobiota bacterium]
MKRKSTRKKDNIGKPEQDEKDQLNSQSLSHENDISAKKSFFIKFGMDRVSYSIAAVLIFLSGIYFGVRYLPAVQEDSYSISYNKDPLIKKDRNLFKRSTTASFSDPEDFFPAAEFRKQAAILIGCQNNLNKSSKLYVDIAKAVAGNVPLLGIVPTEAQALEGAEIMRQNGLPPQAMRFLVMPSNSIWIRDYSPFVLRYDHDRALLIDAKYQTRTERERRKKDDFFSMELAHELDLPVRSIPLMLEGGNMLSNGDGLILTTGKTIAVNEQEGQFKQDQLMSMFNDYMGAHSVYSFAPLVDEPNGHIDMFVTLVAKNIAIVGQVSPGVDPESSRYLDETANTLTTLNTTVGPMRVKRIPMPPKWGSDWRSYTNVIMANKVLLMPSFSDVDPAIENQAEAVYRSVLPSDWSIKRINCDKLVLLHGQLHCISYNIPAFVDIDNLLSHAIPQIQGENED